VLTGRRDANSRPVGRQGAHFGLELRSASPYTARMVLAARIWILRLVPFLDRWAEAAPACCGTCPTCVGATATGAAMTFVGSLRRNRD
jgi:hypothetical protein